MQTESDSESEDCGISLVPQAVAVSKSRGVDYRLRTEISFLSELKKEFEVNMLEVKKELLDEKIHKKNVEEQRKEFLPAVIKGRHQWQQKKESLEKELTELREKAAELTGKLKWQELNPTADKFPPDKCPCGQLPPPDKFQIGQVPPGQVPRKASI